MEREFSDDGTLIQRQKGSLRLRRDRLCCTLEVEKNMWHLAFRELLREREGQKETL